MIRAAFLTAILFAPALASAQDTFPGTEYVTGKAGFEKKIKGTLIVEEKEVRFADKNGKTIFSIPMEHIATASDSKENEEGGVGRKLALGVFASKTEEFLEVHTQTADSAEAIVFKCKKKTSPGIAAKINFYVKKRGAEPPPPSASH